MMLSYKTRVRLFIPVMQFTDGLYSYTFIQQMMPPPSDFAFIRHSIVPAASCVGITAGCKAGPSGNTDWGVCIGSSETGPVFGQSIEIGRLHLIVTVTA